MTQWADTPADEFEQHSILAGVFRRAGQGTTGVSIDDEMATSTSAQMIYTFAQFKWADKLEAGTAVFFNPMLNDIATKSVASTPNW
jgi:predicted transcriptional regulator